MTSRGKNGGKHERKKKWRETREKIRKKKWRETRDGKKGRGNTKHNPDWQKNFHTHKRKERE